MQQSGHKGHGRRGCLQVAVLLVELIFTFVEAIADVSTVDVVWLIGLPSRTQGLEEVVYSEQDVAVHVPLGACTSGTDYRAIRRPIHWRKPQAVQVDVLAKSYSGEAS